VKVTDDQSLVGEACMVAGDMDFHGGILSEKRRGAVDFYSTRAPSFWGITLCSLLGCDGLYLLHNDFAFALRA
jgi:hypothetical protein